MLNLLLKCKKKGVELSIKKDEDFSLKKDKAMSILFAASVFPCFEVVLTIIILLKSSAASQKFARLNNDT